MNVLFCWGPVPTPAFGWLLTRSMTGPICGVDAFRGARESFNPATEELVSSFSAPTRFKLSDAVRHEMNALDRRVAVEMNPRDKIGSCQTDR